MVGADIIRPKALYQKYVLRVIKHPHPPRRGDACVLARSYTVEPFDDGCRKKGRCRMAYRPCIHANLFAIHDTKCQFMLSLITIHAPKVQFILYFYGWRVIKNITTPQSALLTAPLTQGSLLMTDAVWHVRHNLYASKGCISRSEGSYNDALHHITAPQESFHCLRMQTLAYPSYH